MQHGDALGQVQSRVHVVFDQQHRYFARDAGDQLGDAYALLARKSGQRFVEQQQPRILRKSHRDLDSPFLAIGNLADVAPGEMFEPDAAQHAPGLAIQVGVVGERPERIPATPRQAELRQRDVVLERVVGKQRDDLVGAGQAAVRPAMRPQPRDFLAEKPDRAGVGRQVAGDQVEKRRLAGAVRSDDQPPLARHHLQRHVVRRRQAAERLSQSADLQRGGHFVLQRVHRRRTPGTSPSGTNSTIATKTNPSSMFQRSIYAET